ncbi:MAG: hypothetical protein R6V57_03600 [Vicinamibacterales bacterium]
MNRTSCAVVLSLLVVTLSAPALAQDATARKVTLDLNGVAPAAAFKAVADAIGVTVTVDAAVTNPVDITVRNVSARTALNAMCESVGCRWTLSGGSLAVKAGTDVAAGTYYAVSSGKGTDRAKVARTQVVLNALKQTLPADMKFDNAPLDAINTRLSEALNMNVQLSCKDANVQTLTMDFSNLTLQEALKSIGEQEVRPGAAWRLTIGPVPGDTETPSIAIMVGPKKAKKAVTKR